MSDEASDLTAAIWGPALRVVLGLALFTCAAALEVVWIKLDWPAQATVLGACIPVVALASAVLLGAGVGITVAAARTPGDATAALRTGLLVIGALAGLVGLVVVVTARPLLEGLGLNATQAGLGSAYLTAWMFALVLGTPVFALGAYLRGVGDPGGALRLLATTAIVTIAAQPLLILPGVGLGLGIAGAGLAAIAGYLAGGFALLLSKATRKALHAAVCGAAPLQAEVVRTGATAALSQMVDPLAMLLLTVGVARMSINLLDPQAVLGRLERLVVILPVAMAMTLPRLYAQAAERSAAVLGQTVRAASLSALVSVGVVGGVGGIAIVITNAAPADAVLAMVLNAAPVAVIIIVSPALFLRGRGHLVLAVSLAQALTFTPLATLVGGAIGRLSAIYGFLAVCNTLAACIAVRLALSAPQSAPPLENQNEDRSSARCRELHP